MPARRGSNWSLPLQQQQQLRFPAFKFRLPVSSLLLVSVATTVLFFAGRLAHFSSASGYKEFWDSSTNTREDFTKLHALQEIEGLFPKEVVEIIKTNTDDSGPLSLNIKVRKDLSSSWVVEKKPIDVNSEKRDTLEAETDDDRKERWQASQGILIPRREALVDAHEEQGRTQTNEAVKPDTAGETDGGASGKITRHQIRLERREKRATELIQHSLEAEANLESEAIDRKKDIDGSLFKKYSIWRRDSDESDALVRLMRDQLIMARVYTSLASAQDDADLLRELNARSKESRRFLGEANVDSDLPRSASEKVKAMGQVLSKARGHLYECKSVTKKLRAMLQGSEDQTRALNKQSAVLRQLVAKTIPKSLHCLTMLLSSDYNTLPKDERDFPGQEKLEDPSFFHYALFSDNVIAAAVVVNSTVLNAKDPEKHVFHVVTDKLIYAAMRMWFLANPPGNATIEVQNIDDFKWLNSSYCPVLRQLQTATMKEYYFKADHPATLADAATNLKYRNPKYLSMLNHLRFYLPEVYPKLDKILFLDDDVVVQQDLTPLWSIDLNGNVNGAVETCGESFHRFDKYLNFSNPLISESFDSNACGWAYGMNIFDLHGWKMRDMTGVYHKWQALNEQRDLWKLGTLPPGLITFYNLTYSLDRRWHVLGLGYDANVDVEDIERAAVVHYNGNMKPWLELSMAKYKPYWTRYLDHNHHFLQHCNVHL